MAGAAWMPMAQTKKTTQRESLKEAMVYWLKTFEVNWIVLFADIAEFGCFLDGNLYLSHRRQMSHLHQPLPLMNMTTDDPFPFTSLPVTPCRK